MNSTDKLFFTEGARNLDDILFLPTPEAALRYECIEAEEYVPIFASDPAERSAIFFGAVALPEGVVEHCFTDGGNGYEHGWPERLPNDLDLSALAGRDVTVYFGMPPLNALERAMTIETGRRLVASGARVRLVMEPAGDNLGELMPSPVDGATVTGPANDPSPAGFSFGYLYRHGLLPKSATLDEAKLEASKQFFEECRDDALARRPEIVINDQDLPVLADKVAKAVLHRDQYHKRVFNFGGHLAVIQWDHDNRVKIQRLDFDHARVLLANCIKWIRIERSDVTELRWSGKIGQVAKVYSTG